MRRALVTGATGYLGSVLANRLVADGVQVTCLARPGSERSRIDDRATVIEVDGSTESIAAAVAAAAPEVVFHLASFYLAEHRPGDIDQLVEANVGYGTRLLEAMSQAGVSALVYAGTSWQHYGDADYDPVCLYAAMKQAFVDVARFYVSARGLRLVTLSVFDTYGVDDPRPKLFSLLRSAASDGRELSMSPGEQLVDLVFSDDVADAFVRAGERAMANDPSTAEEFAVRTGSPIRLRDVVDLWQRVAGCTVAVEWGGRPYRDREVMVPWNGPVLPGWAPSVTLEQGITRMEEAR